jgi:hypothetical protein
MDLNEEASYIELIRQEIEWCKTHEGHSMCSDDFESGFVAGLEQAIFLIKLAKAKLKEA